MAQTDPTLLHIAAAPVVPDRSNRATFPANSYNWYLWMHDTLYAGVNSLADNVYANAVDCYNNAVAAQSAMTSTLAGSATLIGTSPTARTPALGSLTWVYNETGRTPSVGMSMHVSDTANPSTNYAIGIVTAWNSGTKTITINVTAIGPTPVSSSSWNLFPEGLAGTNGAAISATVSLATGASLTGAHAGATIIVSGTGTATLTPLTAATLGANWFVVFPPSSTVNVTINATIANGVPATIYKGEGAILKSTGAAFYLTKFSYPGDHEVTLNTGNSFGSTNTMIARFTTQQRNVGTAITYADSATLGASFTINADGLYELYWAQDLGFGTNDTAFIGFSVNSAQLTTGIDSITTANRLAIGRIVNDRCCTITRMVRLSNGDVVRPHMYTSTGINGNTPNNVASIRKVSA